MLSNRGKTLLQSSSVALHWKPKWVIGWVVIGSVRIEHACLMKCWRQNSRNWNTCGMTWLSTESTCMGLPRKAKKWSMMNSFRRRYLVRNSDLKLKAGRHRHHPQGTQFCDSWRWATGVYFQFDRDQQGLWSHKNRGGYGNPEIKGSSCWFGSSGLYLAMGVHFRNKAGLECSVISIINVV